MRKKAENGRDYIDAALAPRPKKQLYRLTVKIDQNLYQEASPYLEGKFAALMEGAIREALDRLKTGKAG